MENTDENVATDTKTEDAPQEAPQEAPQSDSGTTVNTQSTNAEPATAKAEEQPAEATKEELFDPNKLGILNEVSVLLTIEVGRTQIKIRDLLNLTKGSVVELNKLAGDPVDIYANGKLISIGNIITVNGKYCVRLTSIPDNKKVKGPSDGK